MTGRVRQPAVYVMASRRNGTLYTGVTSDLTGRVHTHRSRSGGGFAAKYACVLLVWFELHTNMTSAIEPEKQIKSCSRAKKIALIEAGNEGWRDLFPSIVEQASPAVPLRDPWLASPSLRSGSQ